MEIKSSLAVLFISIIFSYIFPVIYVFFYLLSIYIFFISIFTKGRKKYKRWLYLAAFLLILRLIGFSTGYYLSRYSEPPPKDLRDVYNKMGLLIFAAPVDGGIIENNLRNRRINMHKRIRNLSEGIIGIIECLDSDSPATGTIKGFPDIYATDDDLKWIKKNRKLYLYSIGPDKKDSNAELLYDPTNGIGSPGDIVYWRDLSKE